MAQQAQTPVTRPNRCPSCTAGKVEEWVAGHVSGWKPCGECRSHVAGQRVASENVFGLPVTGTVVVVSRDGALLAVRWDGGNGQAYPIAADRVHAA